jgi:hypothetical protein
MYNHLSQCVDYTNYSEWGTILNQSIRVNFYLETLVPIRYNDYNDSTIESWVGIASLCYEGGEAMEVKDAITIMFLFGMFIIALLTYINHNNKRK